MNTRLTSFLFIIALTGFFSCKNNDNVLPQEILKGSFKFVNASSNSLNYFLNGTRINSGGSLPPGYATFYFTTPLGQQNFEFKTDGSPDVLFAWPELIDSLNHTLYITGSTADKAFRTNDTLFVDTGFVALSFVNAAPDAGSLDVFVGDTLRFSGKEFKSKAAFTPVADGEREIKVFKSGTNTLLADTTFTMNLNHIYTLYSYGQPGGTGNSKFGVGITLNL
ncbi:MAG TPA: DUF4397 domain-containing protein [Mucilaginibacter sp.]|nr:DUF4397 domain-containing protein [Mucilaginibacter sp.]